MCRNILLPAFIAVCGASTMPFTLGQSGRDSREFVEQGDRSKDREEWSKAVEQFTAAIAIDPKCVDAFYGRGFVYARTGELKKAIDDFSESIRLDPLRRKAYLNRGNCYAQTNQLEKAAEDFTVVIRLDPTSELALCLRASVLEMLGDIDKALADIDGSLRLNPNYVDARILRGRLYGKKGNYDKSIDDLTEAIRLDPTQEYAFYNRACARGYRHEIDEALMDAEVAMRLNSKNTLTWALRGRLLARKGQYEKAIEDFTQAIRLDAKNADAFHNRAIARLRQNDFKGAIADIEEALRLSPQNEWTRRLQVDYNLFNDRPNEALNLAEQFVQACPNSALAHFTRGHVRQCQGEWQKAVSDFTRSIELDPKFIEAYCSRSIIGAACDDPNVRDLERAWNDAKKACELSRAKMSRALEALAVACAARGEFEEAVKWQKKVVEDADYVNSTDMLSQLWLQSFEKRQKVVLKAKRKDD